MVITSENKTEFERENTGKVKCVVLTLELSLNSRKLYLIIRLQIIKYLLVFKY